MIEQIKITFLTDRMIKGHGVDLVVDRLADGLVRKRYLCEVYANTVDETFANRQSYRIYKLPNIGLANFYVLERRIRKFAGFFNSRDTDLFIIQSFPFYSLIPLLKSPALVVDHGIVSTIGMPLKRRIYYKYQQLSQNLSYFRKAKKVICVSNYLLNQLPDYIKGKAASIYNGVDHYREDNISKEEISDFRSNLGISENDILLLYVGRLNLTNQPYKGLAELVNIYQKVSLKNKNIKLLVVGYGSKNDEELLKNQGLISLRNVPEEMMPMIYNASDIYTTCSKWEGFDLPVGESQYFSKPVICYDIAAHPEIMINEKTGFIVKNAEEFSDKIIVLSEDAKLRKQMGKDAGEFISKFSWQNSVDNYDKEIKKIFTVKTTKKLTTGFEKEALEESFGIKDFGPKSGNKKVSIIIVNYNSSYPCIKECIESLKNQTYKNIEILIFDNNSQNNTMSLIKNDYSDIKIINSDKNLGLGAALNQSIKNVNGEYILISNFDVTYDKIAVEELAEEITKLDNKFIGLAPKIKLYYQKEYIESVGIFLYNNFYIGYNGIGQLDLDQYNKIEDIFGVSFTSAFLKRECFSKSMVGEIDPTFFLFYEDIDFCYRANLLGYKFKSCPTSICFHKYAYSFRDEATSFQVKYYYQKLNCMKTVYKDAELQNVKRTIVNELGIQKQNLKDRNLKEVAINIIRDYKKSLRYLKRKRAYIQITRQVSDWAAVKFAWGENNFFDFVRNEPVYCISNLLLTYKRLFAITGNRKYEEYINYLTTLENTKFNIESDILKKLLHGKLEYEPASIHAFIEKID
ncbi:MAG: glycosyltransferase [Actinobacteria bacterium]|nr:glycosyltransferase [Actinomycetota bacterium]